MWIELGNVEAIDKLSITMLECICYILTHYYKYYVRINFTFSKNIVAEGIQSSPLMLLKANRVEDFEKKFLSEIYKNHYRKIIPATAAFSGELCIIMSDIDSFLKLFNVEEDYRDAISEVIVELAGNASEHGNSDCLVDIDVTSIYCKRDAGGVYRGLNLSLLNFSESLMGTALQEKIKLGDLGESRYNIVKTALHNHSRFFDDQYFESDFFMVAAFQDKISSRKNNVASGGTGLTKLICSLEERSEAHTCYVIGGNRKMSFVHEYLEYDADGWIGFNKSHDFINTRPDTSIFSSIPVYFPGTAYNLNFVMKENDNEY